MCFWTKCKWVEIGKTYSPPRGSSGTFNEGQGIVAIEMMERIMHGVTTVIFQCSKCHDIRIETMLGKSIDKH